MADRVIVVGTTRNKQRVPTSEIKQMVGRAGRKHKKETCYATVIVEEENAEEVKHEMEGGESMSVLSTLGNSEVLAFHILPEVCTGEVSDSQSAAKWYSRSFAAFQGIDPKFDKVFNFLLESDAIRMTGDKIEPTPTGKIASRLYLHPADIWAWKRNFSTVFEYDLEGEDLAVAWALGSVPVMRMSGDFGKNWDVVRMCKDGIPPGLDIMEGTVITTTLWWNVLGGPSVGKMRNQALTLRRDSGRVFRALKMIDEDVAHWDMTDFFDSLESRCKKGIPIELADLCKLPGITKGRARYLQSIGVTDVDGIRESLDSLEEEIDPDFMRSLRDIANGVFTKSN